MNIHTIIKPSITAVLAFVSFCMFAYESQAESHIHTVTQSGFTFSPNTLEINEGDIVQWNWTSGGHTVTNGLTQPGGDLFNQPLNSGNPTVSYTFENAGTFPYFCDPHFGFNMKGTITVVAAPGDTTPPVIVITGDNPATVIQFDTYTDEGATATDDVDGVITNNIETQSNVTTIFLGQYSVTYNVSDAAGNPADEKTRIVNVVAPADTTPPVIMIVGDNPATVFQNSLYIDDGATATDNVDGVITDDIETASNVIIFVVGQYSVTYNVSDTAGNNADEKTRTVNVIANLDPSNIYVDRTHDGLEVGTDVNPFKTVASAIAVAGNNAVINITVGSYAENFESSTLSPLMVTLQVNGDGTVTIGDDVIAALISGFRTRPIKEKSQDGEK